MDGIWNPDIQIAEKDLNIENDIEKQGYWWQMQEETYWTFPLQQLCEFPCQGAENYTSTVDQTV